MADATLEQYYQHFYPFNQLYQWLNHSLTPTNDIMNREIAMNLPNDAFIRYQSYTTADELKKDVIRLTPTRFEIGPVYTANPRDRRMYAKHAFKPVSKELVFDIDLTDYDPVRTCCQDKAICIKCWQFVTVAIEILGAALKDDFGFEHILWVYSGRRGVHAWVCDPKARGMDEQQRKAITSYLHIQSQGTARGVSLPRPLHPHMARSFDILKSHFEPNILVDQDPWREPKDAATLLRLLRNDQLASALKSKWGEESISSSQRWRDIDEVARTMPKSFNANALRDAKQDIILEYMYPRLDVNVSKTMNHLLKAPFCVHPSTGKVCVLIDDTKADQFDPDNVPTIQHLVDQLNGDMGPESASDIDKTALKPYVQYFTRFVTELNRKSIKRTADMAEL